MATQAALETEFLERWEIPDAERVVHGEVLLRKKWSRATVLLVDNTVPVVRAVTPSTAAETHLAALARTDLSECGNSDNNVPQSEFITDGITTLDAGINSGIAPELLKNNQLSFATNMTMRGGFGRTRPPFKKLALNFFSNLILQDRVENALWQGAAFFKSEYGFESLVASIGGRIIEFIPDAAGNSADVFDRTPVTNGLDDPNSEGTTIAWLWQSERWMIITNGQQLPIFWDGQTSRRSFGPARLVGTAAVDFTAPDQGSTVVITLTGNYTGPYNSAVLIDGSFYQINSSGTGYKITLKSLTESAGQTVPAGLPVIIPPNLIGVTVAPVNTTNGFYPGRFQDAVVQFDKPISSSFIPICTPSFPFGQSPGLPGWAHTYFRSPDTGQTFISSITLQEAHSPHCPQTQTNEAAGILEVFQYGSAPANVSVVVPARSAGFCGPFNSTTQAGVLVSSFVTPALDSTVDVVIAIPYNGPIGTRVVINGGIYEIVATNNTPVPSNTIVAQNINDTSGTVHGPTSGNPDLPGQIFTIPELPICKQGAYGKGRNWVVLPDGRSYIASDIVGGGSGSPAVNFRDAVLRVTENDLLAGGGAFVVPGNIGDINWLGFAANLDTSLGQGPLQIGTASTIFSCDAPVERDKWALVTNPIQTEALKGKGPLSFYGTVFVNSDTVFRASDGIGSLIIARRDFDVWGNVPISFEVQRVIDADDPQLLGNSTAIQFDNRLLMSAIPFQMRLGVAHQGIIAMNLDPISGLRGKAPSIYDGFWTGLNAYQFVVGKFRSIERGFAFCYEAFSTRNALYEIKSESNTDNFDNDTIPITTSMEIAPMFNNSKQKGQFDVVQMEDGEIYLSALKGVVHVESWFRPLDSECWTPWHKFSICANNLQSGAPTQYRHRLGLGKPDIKKCDPTNDRPFCVGTAIQTRFQITGAYKMMGALFKAVPYVQTQFAKQICDPLCDVVAAGQTCEPCKDQGDCLTFPLVFYNLNDNKQYENAQKTITVTCPNGKVQQVTIPAGTVKFTLPFPPGYTGDYPPLVMKCGDGFIVRELPSGSTQDQIDDIVFGMIQECVNNLANVAVDCNEVFTNDEVTFTHECAVGEVLTYTGTLPAWITLDTGTSQLIGAAGIFTGATKEDATTAAQNALNEFANTALGNNTLKCVSASPPPTIVAVNDDTSGWVGGDTVMGFVENGGTFFGLGSSHFYSSVNGVNWTDLGVHNAGFFGVTRGQLTFGNATYASVDVASGLITSPDGLNWTVAVVAGAASMFDVIYAGGKFVAVGNGGVGATSPDGATWTAQATGMAAAQSIAFGAGLYVAVGTGEEIFSSPDGATWTSRHAGADTLSSVCFANGLFVAVGSNQKCFTSPDGIVWTPQTVGGFGSINAAGGGSGLFVVQTNISDLYTSPDGAVWTNVRTVSTSATRSAYFSVANVIDVGLNI